MIHLVHHTKNGTVPMFGIFFIVYLDAMGDAKNNVPSEELLQYKIIWGTDHTNIGKRGYVEPMQP